MVVAAYPKYFVYEIDYELVACFYTIGDLEDFIGRKMKVIWATMNTRKVIGVGLGYRVKNHYITTKR
jgi:hypothetical protein